jgi:hypothetical protein
MSKDQADLNATAAGVAPSGAAPLLRTLGDANAAVCTDGFCEVPQLQEVPQRQELAPEQEATMGVDE